MFKHVLLTMMVLIFFTRSGEALVSFPQTDLLGVTPKVGVFEDGRLNVVSAKFTMSVTPTSNDLLVPEARNFHFKFEYDNNSLLLQSTQIDFPAPPFTYHLFQGATYTFDVYPRVWSSQLPSGDYSAKFTLMKIEWPSDEGYMNLYPHTGNPPELYQSSPVAIRVVSVPEPASIGILGLGLALFVRRPHRR